MQNSAAVQLYDLLVTRDFEPEALDSQGKPVTNPEEAELFKFDWKTPEKNYGTAVVLLGDDADLQVYYGDNLGRGMEKEDRGQWYDFLKQLKDFAMRNLLTFETQNINRLKYAMQGMAAIREGLFEGYYGTRKVSYSDQPKKTRLMIRHNRDLGENEARYRAIESLFVETADGERFRVPSKSLMHGKLLARHVSEGGTPYDAFGQHINQIMQEMATLARFVRAARNRDFQGAAADMTEAAIRHYGDLKAKAKRIISQRGYREERDNFDPAEITDVEQIVSEIRNMFVEQSLDHRIQEALPILARLSPDNRNPTTEAGTKQSKQFESWAEQVMEGTWALPEGPAAINRLNELMSEPLPVGADATNATEQLYDLLGDDKLFDQLAELADMDANADARPLIQRRLEELNLANILQPRTQDTTTAMEDQTKQSRAFSPVRLAKIPQEGAIYHVQSPDFDLLPGFKDNSTSDDYSDTFYYRDPVSLDVFAVYAHDGKLRVRGTGDMSEQRMREIQKELESVKEDLDTDGVMMTRPSNMSSESKVSNPVNRLTELAGL